MISKCGGFGLKSIQKLVIFIHLKLWVAVARHNFKWLKIKLDNLAGKWLTIITVVVSAQRVDILPLQKTRDVAPVLGSYRATAGDDDPASAQHLPGTAPTLGRRLVLVGYVISQHDFILRAFSCQASQVVAIADIHP